MLRAERLMHIAMDAEPQAMSRLQLDGTFGVWVYGSFWFSPLPAFKRSVARGGGLQFLSLAI